MPSSKMSALSLAALAILGAASPADAGRPCCGGRVYTRVVSTPAPAPALKSVVSTVPPTRPVDRPANNSRVVYKIVQRTAQYDIQRAEVVSGARVTLFANFLQQEPGYVLFKLNGTTTECKVVDWQPDSVTAELPRLGLSAPKDAEVSIVLPSGRIAKTFKVLYVPQPDITVHADTVPQPTPPSPGVMSATYAMPVRGGLVLQGE